MRLSRRQRLSDLRTTTTSINLVIGLLGLLAAITFLLLADLNNPAWLELLYLVAGILLSAAIVSLILQRAVVREQQVATRATIEQAIEDAMTPIALALREDSQADYRWHALISLAPPDDPHPDYAIERIEIRKTVADLPDRLRAVVISAAGDRTIGQFAGQEYLFRWVLEPELSPFDENAFRLDYINVCGEPLEVDVSHGPERSEALELHFSVPSAIIERHSKYEISFGFRVRKYMGADASVSFRTQLFATTFGAEFRCTLDGSLDAIGFHASTSEVSFLGPREKVFVSSANDGLPGQPRSIAIQFSNPLASGSAVAFTMKRSPST